MPVVARAVAVEGIGYGALSTAVRGWIAPSGADYVNYPAFELSGDLTVQDDVGVVNRLFFDADAQLTISSFYHMVDLLEFTVDVEAAIIDQLHALESTSFFVDVDFILKAPSAIVDFSFIGDLVNFTDAASLIGKIQPASPQLRMLLANAEASEIVSVATVLTVEGISASVLLTAPASVLLEVMVMEGKIDLLNAAPQVGSWSASTPMIEWGDGIDE